ncbi:MAG: hypothetical protein NC548_54865 [Lachnospiraceae bacterium]|nr:hypothetical protein [Lachnospiraceae bacterium]
MKFEEVINALRNGQKIVCKEWCNKGHYVTKDSRASIDIYNICFGNWEIVPEKVKPKLTETDRTILLGLQAMGYKWIAHDENDRYDFAFTEKPYKIKNIIFKNGTWYVDDELDWDCVEVTNVSIAKWSDDEPLSIDWLLENE